MNRSIAPSPENPILLSRVAESAYWAGRYLERAEGMARLIKSHSELVIDLPRDGGLGWEPLLAVVGTELGPEYDLHTEEAVIDHLAHNHGNPGSICTAIEGVHYNLRVTRSVMPIEAAELIIELHAIANSDGRPANDRRTRRQWLTNIMRSCQTLSAILNDTMTHDDAFSFFTVGRQLERADLTTRVLDVHAGVLTGRPTDALAPYAGLCWAATLRSVSMLQAFRRRGVAASPTATLDFLLNDTNCPRTVRSCMAETSRWLLELPRNPDATAACAAVESFLQSANVEELAIGDLHGFADSLERAISQVHRHIHTTWFRPAATADSS